MASLIANGTAEEASGDIALLDGANAVVSLRPAVANDPLPARAAALIQLKTSDNTYATIPDGVLTAESWVKVIPGPATYRVVRRACATAFGVDKT
jgi:hypothetical protein